MPSVSWQHRYPTLKVTSEPASEPVTAAEALFFAQHEAGDSDSTTLMTSLVKAARRKVERDASVALITQTRTAVLDSFPPADWQEFHVWPVQSATVSYVDENGDTQTWSSGLWQSDFQNIPPRIGPVDGETWPDTASNTFQAVTFTLVCGYGASASSVPEEAKLAIKLLAKEWFWNRCPTGEVGQNIQYAYGAMIDAISWRPQVV
ncbi:MAG: hypothetical protein E6Q97_06455 [Desulfurellales bacterium]|nr:MAG: hypothetical protein E6Q97_06455 [Desulfurellales bacterium]